MIVTIYLSTRQGSKPEFQCRREMDALPSVGSHLEISGHEAGEMLRIKVNATSEKCPKLSALVGDEGVWVICQED